MRTTMKHAALMCGLLTAAIAPRGAHRGATHSFPPAIKNDGTIFSDKAD